MAVLACLLLVLILGMTCWVWGFYAQHVIYARRIKQGLIPYIDDAGEIGWEDWRKYKARVEAEAALWTEAYNRTEKLRAACDAVDKAGITFPRSTE